MKLTDGHLDPFQSGFRPMSRTERVLGYLRELDRVNISLLIILAFSVAFNNINHSFLLDHMSRVGIGQNHFTMILVLPYVELHDSVTKGLLSILFIMCLGFYESNGVLRWGIMSDTGKDWLKPQKRCTVCDPCHRKHLLTGYNSVFTSRGTARATNCDQ